MAQDFANREIRKVDAWIAYLSTRPWIRSLVFIVAYLEATISPILPELLVAAILSYRKDISWWMMSFYSALGSATGAGTLYIAGKFLYANYQVFFDALVGTTLGTYSEKVFEHSTFISMFLAAFTPLPDRVFALLSGVFALSLPIVFSAFFLGRYIRVGIVAYFSFHFGDEAREFILKHTRMATYGIAVIIALYIAFKYLGIL